MTDPPLSPDERADLAQLGTERAFARGARILSEGDDSRHVVLLTRGRVAVTTTTAGGKSLLLAIRGAGDLLGELAALDEAPRTATVVAMEAVRATVVDAPAFLSWLRGRPDVTIHLLQLLARRLRESDRRRVDVSARDVPTRVARQLLELAAEHGLPGRDGLLLDVPMSQEDLAAAVGTSREAVNLALGELRRAGIVSTSRMRISLLDVDALRSLALDG